MAQSSVPSQFYFSHLTLPTPDAYDPIIPSMVF